MLNVWKEVLAGENAARKWWEDYFVRIWRPFRGLGTQIEKEELYETDFNASAENDYIIDRNEDVKQKLIAGRTQWVIFNMLNLKWHRLAETSQKQLEINDFKLKTLSTLDIRMWDSGLQNTNFSFHQPNLLHLLRLVCQPCCKLYNSWLLTRQSIDRRVNN